MADSKYNVEIALKSQVEEGEKVIGVLDNINKKVEGISNNTASLNSVWAGSMLNIGAKVSNLALKIPNLAITAIKAYGQQEVATQKLAAAIRSQGGSVSEILPIMRQFASEMQRITTYGDEQILAMQAMASSMGVSAEEMNNVIQIAQFLIPRNTISRNVRWREEFL